MKRVGIRLLLSLILVTMLVVAGTVPASAKGKPVKLGITITDISEGSITVDYRWDKIGAHYYIIGVYNSTIDVMGYTGQIDLEGRTPNYSGNMTFTNSNITCGQTYRAYMWLLRTPTRRIHGGAATDSVFFACPSLPFEEDFTGVAQYSLPEGWATNNSSLIYVWNQDFAGGTAPELLIDIGDDANTTYDYWVRTHGIDAGAATTTLNLTFRHGLWIYNFAKNFTYSVEVSNDLGSTWTAILEETPTEAQYPGKQIGPETVNIDLGGYMGDTILIRWRLRGYTYYSNGWDIDDITVDGS